MVTPFLDILIQWVDNGMPAAAGAHHTTNWCIMCGGGAAARGMRSRAAGRSLERAGIDAAGASGAAHRFPLGFRFPLVRARAMPDISNGGVETEEPWRAIWARCGSRRGTSFLGPSGSANTVDLYLPHPWERLRGPVSRGIAKRVTTLLTQGAGSDLVSGVR